MAKPNWLLIGLVGILIIGVFYSVHHGGGPDGTYDALAQCMSQNDGATLYGAYWCSHCAEQKEMFGSSFQYINYVECVTGGPRDIPANPALCAEMNITGYPTWIFSDGSRFDGVTDLAKLADKTGCMAFLPMEGS